MHVIFSYATLPHSLKIRHGVATISTYSSLILFLLGTLALSIFFPSVHKGIWSRRNRSNCFSSLLPWESIWWGKKEKQERSLTLPKMCQQLHFCFLSLKKSLESLLCTKAEDMNDTLCPTDWQPLKWCTPNNYHYWFSNHLWSATQNTHRST